MLLHRDDAIEELFAEPRFAVAFARIESHYVAQRGFLDEGQLSATWTQYATSRP